jgi:NAD(P)-dependent dehydrogenase (short-subunit alcohol dehydrogenase family)
VTLDRFSFAGKRAVVTGAASGMGRCVARLLHEDGAEVIGVDRNPIDLPVDAREVDLTDPTAVDDLVASIGGPVDVLLNCAGGSRFAAVDIWKVNFLGLRRLTDGLVPSMPAGSAVGIIAGRTGVNWHGRLDDFLVLADADDDAVLAWLDAHPDALGPGLTGAYGWVKGAVIVYTYTRAADLAPKGIRVNCTMPGATRSRIEPGRDPMDDPQMARSVVHVGRMATVEEQAYPLLFLCSDAATYVSGTGLLVDAGGVAGYITGRVELPGLITYEDMRRPTLGVI